ncbi:MAG: hypothetical protein RTV41_14570 [Candidatus Thorarchaeota archaeon]
MTSLKIHIENAILMVTDIKSCDGTIGFNAEVSAHVLRNNGGSKVSVYIHDKRNLQLRS